jgi:addiction module RelE/StbE family toxin
MATVVVSRAAQKDLQGIHSYIRDELVNPEAARRILEMLKRNMMSLADMPQRGKLLDTVLSGHTEYRFIVCENYRVFYLCNGDIVEIIRVLHTLQDYVRALFL